MAATFTAADRAAPSAPLDRDELRHAIEHAAHLLPAQGPLAVFVHHNTLHALEGRRFEDALRAGAARFGCHTYLTEARYRELLNGGRIRQQDLEATLIRDLGDHGDLLLGYLGTRFHLRQAMLRYSLHAAPAAELQWVVEKTDALRRFRPETPEPVRTQTILDTRRWARCALLEPPASAGDGGLPTVDETLRTVLARFDDGLLEQEDEAAWETFSLHLLWQFCLRGAALARIDPPLQPAAIRPRDRLLEATGVDCDQLVDETLAPLCAAFIDQGLADWSMPDREHGLYHCFLAACTAVPFRIDRWKARLQQEASRLSKQGLDPLDSIIESLRLMHVDPAQRDEFIAQTLLALRGFAGMIWQMETRADRAVRAAPTGSLVEFLAVRLILDRMAAEHVSRTEPGVDARNAARWNGEASADSAERLYSAAAQLAASQRMTQQSPSERKLGREPKEMHPAQSVTHRAFAIFQLAQVLGWSPEALSKLPPGGWTLLVREIEAFSGIERRRVYHLAYERRFREQALDALASYNKARRHETMEPGPDAASNRESRPGARRPAFQLICCIDDREESLRRHLEEWVPACETFGTAGFFATAMYFRGAAQAHFTPLCPIVVKPRHYVAEDAIEGYEQADHRRRARRRRLGAVVRQWQSGSRTMAGGWLTSLAGALASVPLVMQILFPRATAQFRKLSGRLVRPPQATRLRLERTAEPPGPEPGHQGFTLDEMAGIVQRMLRDIGLTSQFARLVVVLGHGSSSLNNPHESAYNCGACAGSRGGPNARAFAQMANDRRVRALLRDSGLEIPDDVHFVGGMHNTCDDAVEFFDQAQIPPSHADDFRQFAAAMDVVRARNAHERCRRFESAPLKISAEAALRHVEARAVDLSQVRPEYNHATNALCLIGRREWSRGLFLDRRAFLQSYDPAQDADGAILARILQAVIPVCAGISLEYFFSCVDPSGFGAGNKLPHNIVSLLGVMEGASGDLRPGLYRQMVEIHEPMRLLFVIETTAERLQAIVQREPGLARLIEGEWVQLAIFDPALARLQLYESGQFVPYHVHSTELPTAPSSRDWYRGWREHLGFARISPAAAKAPPAPRASDAPAACDTSADSAASAARNGHVSHHRREGRS